MYSREKVSLPTSKLEEVDINLYQGEKSDSGPDKTDNRSIGNASILNGDFMPNLLRIHYDLPALPASFNCGFMDVVHRFLDSSS